MCRHCCDSCLSLSLNIVSKRFDSKRKDTKRNDGNQRKPDQSNKYGTHSNKSKQNDKKVGLVLCVATPTTNAWRCKSSTTAQRCKFYDRYGDSTRYDWCGAKPIPYPGPLEEELAEWLGPFTSLTVDRCVLSAGASNHRMRSS